MTQKTTTQMPLPEGVAAGSTATFRLPVGKRYHGLFLEYAYNASTQNVSHFEEIRVYANGSVIQRFTGTERDILNRFDGFAASTGILAIPFDRKAMFTLAGAEETAINTASRGENGISIESFYVEIDLASSGLTISTGDLKMYALESDSLPGGPGTIPFIRRETRTAAGASNDFQIADLVNPGVNAPDKVALQRVTFKPNTGTIDNLKVDRNQYTIFDRSDELNRAIQGYGERSAQAGYYMIDPLERGVAGEVINLQGITDYRYRLDVSAAMTIVCTSEYLGFLSA